MSYAEPYLKEATPEYYNENHAPILKWTGIYFMKDAGELHGFTWGVESEVEIIFFASPMMGLWQDEDQLDELFTTWVLV